MSNNKDKNLANVWGFWYLLNLSILSNNPWEHARLRTCVADFSSIQTSEQTPFGEVLKARRKLCKIFAISSWWDNSQRTTAGCLHNRPKALCVWGRAVTDSGHSTGKAQVKKCLSTPGWDLRFTDTNLWIVNGIFNIGFRFSFLG